MPDDGVVELPELARSLRAFGSARRAEVEEARRFFAPLLDARRRAADAASWADAVAAFDPAALDRDVVAGVERIAAERRRGHPAAARALVAELEELVEPLRSAIAALAPAGDAVRRQGDVARFIEALRAAFEAADRAWLDLEPVLVRAAAERRPARRAGGRP